MALENETLKAEASAEAQIELMIFPKAAATLLLVYSYLLGPDFQ